MPSLSRCGGGFIACQESIARSGGSKGGSGSRDIGLINITPDDGHRVWPGPARDERQDFLALLVKPLHFVDENRDGLLRRRGGEQVHRRRRDQEELWPLAGLTWCGFRTCGIRQFTSLTVT
jgi:hypothetical protein